MNGRYWKWLPIFMVFMLIAQALLSDVMVLAQGKVTISVEVSPSVIQPGEPFKIMYSITNSMDKPIKVRIREDFYNHRTNENETTVFERSIAPGEKQEISSADGGSTYVAIDGYVTYRVEYQVEGQSEWAVLKEGTFDIFNIGFSVSYSASPPQIKTGERVEYVAEVKSTSNVVLEDIVVMDSQLGELGRISRLEPGEEKTVKNKFNLEKSTESYLILKYKDPLAIGGDMQQEFQNARVKVEVVKPQPVYSLSLEGGVDKRQIASPQEVTFTLRIKNTGDVTLKNIQCIDWKGKNFYEIIQLLPGQETVATYKAMVDSAGKYTITCSGVPEDSTQKVEASYTVEISKVEAAVEIERKFEPPKVAPGGIVTLTYTIRNTGKVALKGVEVYEPEMGNIASFDSLRPGEEKVVSIEKEMDDDGIVSKTILTAKDELTGAPYKYEADELLIPAEVSEKAANVSIDVEVEPPSLEKAGAVRVKCTIKNDGGVALRNIEVFIEDLIKERKVGMGSALVLNPGEEKTFNLPYLSVEETSSFVVVVKAQDQEGNDLEFRSQQFEVTVGVTDKAQNPGGLDSGKVAILKTALTVVIFLIILTSGMLIYLVRDSLSFFKRRKSLKHRAVNGD
ncbi:putative membrane protein [Caldicoprobacter guelmensis]|uniref:hypothetical protein n=1 Tax=Caldicoprobacter guelmensis TaxID=1170224 RepID=UPI00195AE392|nr:hypothetical protein [Caldicoprobacter guelmensis]MBM7582575.1 putative membrane protein [Caldicoprobacter guelmensis]